MHERAGKLPFQTQRCPGPPPRRSASGTGIEGLSAAPDPYPLDRTQAPERWQRCLVALTAGSS